MAEEFCTGKPMERSQKGRGRNHMMRGGKPGAAGKRAREGGKRKAPGASVTCCPPLEKKTLLTFFPIQAQRHHTNKY